MTGARDWTANPRGRTYAARVRRAQLPEQQDLADRAEHCSADPQRLAAVGAGRGSQVRVVRGAEDYALYTVREVRPEAPDSVVRMGRAGRERLGTDAEFDAVVDTVVVRSELSDDDARRCSELVERLQDNGRQRRLVVLAPHGGDIEPHTDEQAEQVAACLPAHRVSVWLCRGYRVGGGAPSRWHITSGDLDPRSFPELGSVFDRGFARAVSFHGFDRDDEPAAVVVGGAAGGRLRGQVAQEIGRALAGTGLTVRLVRAGDPLGGTGAANIVNRITASGRGGVQVEQNPAVRDRYALAVAEAVTRVYRGRAWPGRRPGGGRGVADR